MKQLISFPLAGKDDDFVLVEVEEPAGIAHAGRPIVNAGHADTPIKMACDTFEAVLSKIKPAANAVVSQLRDLTDAPDEIEVVFGVKLSAEGGAIIAAAKAEANYTITLKWKGN